MLFSRVFYRFLTTLIIVSFANLFSIHAFAEPSLPSGMAAKVMACTACHRPIGESSNPYFPRLDTQAAGYLFNQLQAFRDGRRKYPTMNYLTSYMSDDYLYEIAHYFAAQHPAPQLGATPIRPAASSSLSAATPDGQPQAPIQMLDHGKQLVLHGDTARQLPACISCHGARLTGKQPAIPGLLGMSRDYLSAQLGAFRSGVRHGKSPDCMQQIALRLNEDDISAVSAWLAALPLPADLSPAAADTTPLPMPCGSQSLSR